MVLCLVEEKHLRLALCLALAVHQIRASSELLFDHLSAETSIAVVQQEYCCLNFPGLNCSFYLFQLRSELELPSPLLFPLAFREEGG